MVLIVNIPAVECYRMEAIAGFWEQDVIDIGGPVLCPAHRIVCELGLERHDPISVSSTITQKAFSSIVRIRGRDRTDCIGVNRWHSCDFVSPVLFIVLNDANTVYPKMIVPHIDCDNYGVYNNLW
jgi:hypothetical protein